MGSPIVIRQLLAFSSNNVLLCPVASLENFWAFWCSQRIPTNSLLRFLLMHLYPRQLFQSYCVPELAHLSALHIWFLSPTLLLAAPASPTVWLLGIGWVPVPSSIITFVLMLFCEGWGIWLIWLEQRVGGEGREGRRKRERREEDLSLFFFFSLPLWQFKVLVCGLWK